jgi:hypothetical protein
MEMTRMKTMLFQLAACAAWAGAFVSSASPVHALAATLQSGNFANCSSDVRTGYWGCNTYGQNFYYIQTIKFNSTACGSSTCIQPGTDVYCDFSYTAGRKTASINYFCSPYLVFALGACAC